MVCTLSNRTVESSSATDTYSLGQRLGRGLAQIILKSAQFIIISIDGSLGAGKTELSKGIANGLDIAAPITSPTYNLHNQYCGSEITLNHFDFYRLQSIVELDNIGFYELVEQPHTVSIIEWASKFPEATKSYKSENKIAITIANSPTNDQARQIIVSCPFKVEL